jgi:V/A-type H+-transporting ATPase subunit I
MIVPMKKVSFVVTNDAKKEALKELRKIGVVHLEQIYGSSEKLSQLKDTYNKLEEVLMFLSDIKYDKKTIEQKKLSSSNVVEKVNQIIELNETKKNYIVYTDNTKDELGNIEVYASIYHPEDNNGRLEAIETEKEWKVIETILETLQEEIKKKSQNNEQA